LSRSRNRSTFRLIHNRCCSRKPSERASGGRLLGRGIRPAAASHYDGGRGTRSDGGGCYGRDGGRNAGREIGHGRVRSPGTADTRLDQARVSPSGGAITSEIYFLAKAWEDDFLGLRNGDILLRQGEVGRVISRSRTSNAVRTGQGRTVVGAANGWYTVQVDAAWAGTGELQRESLARPARSEFTLCGGHGGKSA
jgi:hypothetical protein